MPLTPSWSAVEAFERRMADYCGAPHAVAVDTCTAGLFLCCRLRAVGRVTLPAHTYLGVACSVIHAGGRLVWSNSGWSGSYQLRPYPIVDSACRLRRGMYEPETLTCLSFQYRKHLPIGRGGMVLTDDADSAAWLRAARFNGRSGMDAAPQFIGWHCFLEPERAARGLVLMDSLAADNPDLAFDYPDLSKYSVFT